MWCIFVAVLCDKFLSSSCVACGLCCLNTTNLFSLSYYNVFLCMSDSNGKTYSIRQSLVAELGLKVKGDKL